MREKCNKQRIIDQVSDSFHFPPIDVERIRKTCERVEADSDRENNLQTPMMTWGYGASQLRTSKEVIVLKKTENSQVNDETNGEQNLSSGGRL